MLPNLIIAGTPKSGTTSLYKWLSDHPNVCGADRKELQYFMDTESSVYRKGDNYLENGLDGYDLHFKNFDKSKHSVILEATPGYIYQKNALENIPQVLPNATIIFIVREPLSRLISTFNYFKENKGELNQELNFSKYIELCTSNKEALPSNEFIRDALEHSKYSNYIKKWLENCKTNKILVLNYDDIILEPKISIQELSKVIQIDSDFYKDYNFEKLNSTVFIKNKLLHLFIKRIEMFFPHGNIREYIKSRYLKLNSSKKTNNNIFSISEELKQSLYNYFLESNKWLESEFNITFRSR